MRLGMEAAPKKDTACCPEPAAAGAAGAAPLGESEVALDGGAPLDCEGNCCWEEEVKQTDWLLSPLPPGREVVTGEVSLKGDVLRASFDKYVGLLDDSDCPE
jgi:hypothetical protein